MTRSLIGRRVKVVSLSTKERWLRPGSRGTVQSIDSAGTIHVLWDNGRGLGLLPGDKFRLLPAPSSQTTPKAPRA